jgi:hypothetical protein
VTDPVINLWALLACGIPWWLRRNVRPLVVVLAGAFFTSVLVFALYQIVAMTVGSRP